MGHVPLTRCAPLRTVRERPLPLHSRRSGGSRVRLQRVGTASSRASEAVGEVADRAAGAQQPQYLVQRSSGLGAVDGLNDRLVPVSVSTPSGGHRQQPLHCCQSRAPSKRTTAIDTRVDEIVADGCHSHRKQDRRTSVTDQPAPAGRPTPSRAVKGEFGRARN